MKKNIKRKGMTLIELIIVIAIIAIIAAIAVPSFGSVVKKSKNTAMTVTADRLMKSLVHYVTENDEAIRQLGGFKYDSTNKKYTSLEIIGISDGDSYKWETYISPDTFGLLQNCKSPFYPDFPASSCTLISDSSKPNQGIPSFSNYLDSIIDPYSGRLFKMVILHYDYQYKSENSNPNHTSGELILGGYTNVTVVTDDGTIIVLDNQDGSINQGVMDPISGELKPLE